MSIPILPYWERPLAKLYLGEVREVLRRLPARSVHCAVTSPPYWGLRDYGTGTWEGGSAECDHLQPHGVPLAERQKDWETSGVSRGGSTHQAQDVKQYAARCAKCGAVRTDQQIGMEDRADCLGWATGKQCGECFVCHMVEVFGELRRVLRDDGTLWLNLGDTFDDGQGMVPAAVAMALRADGWRLVQDIIWYAPNKMPESVTSRCSKAHEHIFLLAKGNEYYFDSTAIEEQGKSKPHAPGNKKLKVDEGKASLRNDTTELSSTTNIWSADGFVNKRDVWIVPTQYMKMREDLTPEEKTYVTSELIRRGLL